MKNLLILLLVLAPGIAGAQAPQVSQPLPEVVIDDRGELILDNDDFSFRPWRSDTNPGKVHIVQYFAATSAASKLFGPFTDRLQEVFKSGSYHVTTILNLDAALWGTGGFVLSEAKSSKREFPTATMVLDEEGAGAKDWQLGKKGAALLILDSAGVVLHFSREALSDAEIAAQVDVVRAHIGETVAVITSEQ